jgi:hypothetical protein
VRGIKAFRSIAGHDGLLLIPGIGPLLVLVVVTEEDFAFVTLREGPGVPLFRKSIHHTAGNLKIPKKSVKFLPDCVGEATKKAVAALKNGEILDGILRAPG